MAAEGLELVLQTSVRGSAMGAIPG